MTKGHTGRIASFLLSFFWWWLLTLVTCGIAWLFFAPYFSAAFEARYIAHIGLGVCIAAGLLFLAIYFGSYLLSVKFYEKREL